MKRVKFSIVVLCFFSLLIPFRAFAADIFSVANSSEASLHYDNIKNIDFTGFYSDAITNNRQLYLFYDTQNMYYKILEYKNKGNDDISFSNSVCIFVSSSFTDYIRLHTFSDGASTYTTTTPANNIDATNWKLLAFYSSKHSSDVSYINIYCYSYNPQSFTVNLDLPFLFSTDSGIVRSDSGSSGSGEGTVSVDLTATNTKLDRIKSSIDDMNTAVTSALGTVNSKLENVKTKLDTINTSIGTVNSKLENVKTKLDTINTSIGTLNSNITTQFSNLTTFLTGKFTSLYNVIVYGNEEGEDENELQQMQLENMKTGMTSMNTNISNVPTVINNAADGLGSYIDTFTELYNSFTALNVAISSILYLGLTFILVKKLIGR